MLDELITQVVGYIRAQEKAKNQKRAREDQRASVRNLPEEQRVKEGRNPRPRGFEPKEA